jgi:hypothetical protein
MVEFTGSGLPLTKAALDQIVADAAIGLPELWAVLSVETSGCGYLPDRRPKILFERHVFSRLTGHRFDEDDPDVSQRTAGGYGPAGTHQHDRLNAAMQLDRAAALQSASWGLGQVMGENFQSAGFKNVEEMVASMVASEDNQLRAMMNFMKANRLTASLQSHDWAGFARRYNGPNFAANNYDGLLEHFFERFSESGTPDPSVRAGQVYLSYRGFRPGTIDGMLGNATRRAVIAFQASRNMPQTGVLDEALLGTLSA